MKLVQSTFLSLATLAVVFIAILSGCSGSDPLSTTVGGLVLDFQITDPGSTQYEEASLLLIKAIVRPTSAQSLESLGGAGISLLANQRPEMDLNATSNTIPAASLPAGTYILDEISFLPSGFVPITLVDNDAPTDPLFDCIDRKAVLPGDEFERAIIASRLGFLPSERLIFRPGSTIVIPTDDVVLHPIRIRSELLIQAYRNAMTCSDDELLCRNVSQNTVPPCITGFRANDFITELEGLDWISY